MGVPQRPSQNSAARERPTHDTSKDEENKLRDGDGGTPDNTPLPPISSFSHLRLMPQSFEKDNDDNFHIDFITAASNLRATNYDIAPVDRAESKRIAGRIVPAIVTSTAVAAGLAMLEMLKVVQGHKHIEAYRISEFSLAMCRFFMAEPAPPEYTVSLWLSLSLFPFTV